MCAPVSTCKGIGLAVFLEGSLRLRLGGPAIFGFLSCASQPAILQPTGVST